MAFGIFLVCDIHIIVTHELYNGTHVQLHTKKSTN